MYRVGRRERWYLRGARQPGVQRVRLFVECQRLEDASRALDGATGQRSAAQRTVYMNTPCDTAVGYQTQWLM